MLQRNHLIHILFLFIILSISVAIGQAQLTEKIKAETVIPVFLNDQNATFAFINLEQVNMNLQLSFKDTETLVPPASDMNILLTVTPEKQYFDVDISSWEDGDYEVHITQAGGSGDDKVVRAIRKQTINVPMSPIETINIAGRKILFADDWYIETVNNLARVLHQPEFIPIELGNIDPQYQRIVNRIQNYFFDKDGTLYVNIYSANATENAINSWVKSNDFENWEIINKPVVEKDGIFTNLTQNAVSTKFSGTAINKVYDSQIDGEVNLEQVQIVYSSQSRQFGNITIPPLATIAVWQKPTGEHLLLTPDPITVVTGYPDGIGSWQDANDNFGNLTKSFDGTTLRFYQTRAIPRNDPYRVYYDNILNNRILVTWSSQDGINWEPTYFDSIKRDDPVCLQHYGARVFKAENNNLELAYMLMYDQVYQLINIDLGYSRDGIYWERVEGDNYFAETGDFGTWNYGFLIFSLTDSKRFEYDGYYYEPIRARNVPHYMFVNVYQTPDRSHITADYMQNLYNGRMSGEYGLQTSPIWDEYGSWEAIAQATREDRETAALMRFRKDGWVSMEAGGIEGQFITKAFSTSGKLAINANTAGRGYVKVEVLDHLGTEISDYCNTNAAVFFGDSTEKFISWKNSQILELPESPYRLKVSVKEANLYSLNFEPAQKIIYVNSNASGANNGLNWQDAFTDLQPAIAQAQKGEQIWVAAGVYKPTSRTDGEAKYISFELKDGVAIYGGFLGTETSLEQRNFGQNITILSGDINNDDGRNFSNRSDNSCHIVSADFVYETAILDGFTIKGGNAVLSYPHNAGAGLIIAEYGSPTVANCVFLDNYAFAAAAVWLIDSGSTFINCSFINNKNLQYGVLTARREFYGTIKNCTFSGNTSNTSGAAVYMRESSALVEDCSFINNNASSSAGALMVTDGSKITINECVFQNNTTSGRGGAIYIGELSEVDVIDSTFSQNYAPYSGAVRISGASKVSFDGTLFNSNSATFAAGAVQSYGTPDVLFKNCYFYKNQSLVSGAIQLASDNNSVEIINCIFAGNSADSGGAITLYKNTNIVNSLFYANTANEGSAIAAMSNVKTNYLSNCIVWSNSIYDSRASLIVSYSNIEGGWAGQGNIDAEPLFINPAGVDGIVGTTDDNYRLQAGSPCIDNGSNDAVNNKIIRDIDSNQRVYNKTVDIGPFEYGAMGIFCGDEQHSYPSGDLNKDCNVNFEDIAIIAKSWLINWN